MKHRKGQNALTWLLYFILDLILIISIILIGSKEELGSLPILFGSAVGCLAMFLILLYHRQISFGPIDIIVTVLILICSFIWIKNGPTEAVIWGIISESIVGIHLIIETFKHPNIKYNLTGYAIYLIAALVTVLITSDWSITNSGYAVSETAVTSFTIYPLFTKLVKIQRRFHLF